MGFRGGIVEAADLDDGTIGGYQPAVAYDSLRGEFLIIYPGTTVPLGAQRLRYPNAWNQVYGSGCGPGVIDSDTAPLAGSSNYRMRLSSAPPGQTAVLLLGTGAVGVDLAAIGAPYCYQNVAPVLLAAAGVTNAAGGFTITTGLPDLPLIQGDIYSQFAYVWPARPHTLALGVTRGMRAHIE